MVKGLGGIGDLGKMMAAARDMQGRVEEMQAGLDKISVTGTSGGGLVTATATAKGDLTALSVDPSLFRPEDREAVEDLIVAAVRDAQSKAAETQKAEAARMAESLGLPPGMKLPF